MYSSLILIETLRMCRGFRAPNLKQAVRLAVETVFPYVFRTTIASMFSKSRSITPSKSTRHRSRLFLDVSMLLMEREYIKSNPTVLRFSSHDSSVQHRRDWLSGFYDCVRECDVAIICSAFFKLVHARLDRENGEDPALSGKQLEKAFSVLVAHNRRVDCMPSLLGAGHVDLASKVAACLYYYAILCGDVSTLRLFLKSFCSSTTDMGVEMGFADFKTDSFAGLLPTWVHAGGSLRVENDMGDGDAHPLPEPQDPSGYLLPRCIAFPGILHIVANVCKEMHLSLTHWPTFWSELKVIEQLMRKDRRDVLIHSCVEGSPVANDPAVDFEVFSRKLYEDRWGEIVLFCVHVKVLLLALRQVWDHDAYRRVAKSEDKEFDPKRVTDIMKSNLFFAYLRTIIALDGLPATQISTLG